MYFKCCVTDCNSQREDAMLHKFPANERALQMWLRCLKEGTHYPIDSSKVKNLFVCQNHFEKRFVGVGKQSRLLANAYPSLFTREEIENNIPRKITENVDPLFDHDYSSRKRHNDHNYCKDGTSVSSGTVTKFYADQSHVDHDHSFYTKRRRYDPTCETPISAGFRILEHVDHDHSFYTKRRRYDPTCETPISAVLGDEAGNPSNNNQQEGNAAILAGSTVSHVLEARVLGDEAGNPSNNNQQEGNAAILAGSTVSHVLEARVLGDEAGNPSNNNQQEGNAAILAGSTVSHVLEARGPSVNTVTKTKKSCRRRRVIQKVKTLSPTSSRLYKEYKRAQNQLSFHKRAKRAFKLTQQEHFDKMAENMNIYAKKFLAMQVKLGAKKKKGRRFTIEEKLISLAIMKQSPKCYRFLHKIFVLPSPSTLNKMVTQIDFEPGLNVQIFNLLKKEVNSWKESKKYCSIIFDEMSLGMGLSFNIKKDNINGFVELNQRTSRLADHVLVFMLRGAVHKWQQPVAYYFCEGATSASQLKEILRKIIPAIVETGLKPLVLGCDQGSGFQSAVKSLQEETRRQQLLNNEHPDDTLTVGETKLNIIFDPSHLIKGIRNNFLTKNIKYEGKISQWQDIVQVYINDACDSETRMLHKLNDEHVIPEKVKKMKVKNCVRVLSRTVAAALTYSARIGVYIDGTPASPTLKNTAKTVRFFDDLFDSVNGAATSVHEAGGKVLRTAVHKNSKHHTFWRTALKTLNDMKFVDEQGKEKYVPTLKNFVTTIKSYMRLWQIFKEKGLKFMRPRYFNTDPIENFFGQVRAYNFRNNDPTCNSFMATFKALAITRVIRFHSKSYNCEDDSEEQLLNLSTLFKDVEKENDSVVPPNHPHSEDHVVGVQSVLEQARREKMNIHSRAYVTGWVLRKLFNKLPSCSVCKDALTSSDIEPVHEWISHREYDDCKKKKKLNYPSSKAVRCFGTVLKTTNEYLEKNAHSKGITEGIKNKLNEEYSLDLVDCTEHKTLVWDSFTAIVIRFGVHNWCNKINKILTGVDIERLKRKNLTFYQKMALEKRLKRLKNKSK